MKLYDGALTPTAVRPDCFAAYRALWGRAERREILTAHPLHLDLELTSHCNLRCAMCWQAEELTAPKGFMEAAIFKRLVDHGLGHGLCAIKLQIRGESLMHPRIVELTDYAKRAGVMDVQLTTNGTLFATKPGLLEGLLDAGLDKLIFSIDPAHDESARQIYGAERAPDMRLIVANAMALRNASHPTQIRIQTYAAPGQSHAERLAEVRRAFPEVDEYMVNYLWNSRWNEDSLDGLSTDFELMACSYLWTRLAVFWDGEVHPCCRDYNGVIKFGNAANEALADIWLGQPMMEMRRAHLNGLRKQVPVCDRCDVCTRQTTGVAAPDALWLGSEAADALLAASA